MNQSTTQGTVDQSLESTPKTNNRRRKKILLVVAGVLIVALAIYLLYWFFVSRFVESTDDAYVQGNVVQITPQVAATVTKIYADDTDMVKPGQPLLSLDSSDADLAVQRAEAQLAQTVREVRTLYASQAQSSANLAGKPTSLGPATICPGARGWPGLARCRAKKFAMRNWVSHRPRQQCRWRVNSLYPVARSQKAQRWPSTRTYSRRHHNCRMPCSHSLVQRFTRQSAAPSRGEACK
jgi:multidrug resistance efflux pump